MARITAAGEEAVLQAVRTLKRGGLVIFPTETVYGIGADIRQPEAIKTIFAIKGRNFSQPLLIHCGNKSQLRMMVKEVPEWAEPLIDHFLPGPLALIFFRSEVVPDIVTASRETVGIRVVANGIFASICESLGAPLAGTSANKSGEPGTNDFAKIAPEVIGQVDLAINAGRSGSGRASTILDLTVEPPRIIRKGEIGKKEIERVLGAVVIDNDTPP